MPSKRLVSAVALAAAIGIILRPEQLSAAVKSSVAGCLEVLIPSLFAFTVAAIYLQKSGLYLTALKPLAKPLSLLLRLPEELCAVYLLSSVGGYPVGAKLLSELVRSGRLSGRNAGRMLCFCYSSGPAFVVGTAGLCVFGSRTAGAVLFAACFAASFCSALIVCRTGEPITLAEQNSRPGTSAACFVNSVDSAAKVLYTVCIMSAAFSAVTALLESVGASSLFEKLLTAAGLGSNADRVFPALLDVTQVRSLLPAKAALPLCAALLCFGGVCVLLQVSAITGGIVPLKGLLLSRAPTAALAALLTLPAANLFTPAEPVISAPYTAQPFSVNAGLSVCVLVMAGILMAAGE